MNGGRGATSVTYKALTLAAVAATNVFGSPSENDVVSARVARHVEAPLFRMK